MAKGDHTDLFMIFNDSKGNPIKGESTSVLSSSDELSAELLEGFKWPYLFEIDKFSMSAENDEEKPEDIKRSILKEQSRSANVPGTPVGGKGAAKPARHLSESEIDKQVADRVKKQKGPPVKEISFTRSVDSSSARFLKNISEGKGYRSASLVKRKSGGGTLTGDVYLRIDFKYVLITEVEWDDDDDEVKEDCKFICREIVIQYRPQLPDGTLGVAKRGEWKWEPPKH